MAYRNDVDALEARLAAVQRDLDSTTRDRDETARMLEEARAGARNEELAADYAAGGPIRRRRKRAAFIAGAALLATVGGIATYQATRPSSTAHFDEIMAQFTAFETEICACKGKACADRVLEKMNKWSTGLAQQAEESTPRRPTEEQMKRMSTVAEHFGQCMTSAMSTGE